MVKSINRDIILLSRKAAPATAEDLGLARDLAETLAAHREGCVGMAANMIGVPKRIIAFFDGDEIKVMLNPELLKASGKYDAEEGCLSLDGTRKCVRYRDIKVKWQTLELKPKIASFTGFTAQIIQHELDHLEGVII